MRAIEHNRIHRMIEETLGPLDQEQAKAAATTILAALAQTITPDDLVAALKLVADPDVIEEIVEGLQA